MLQERFDSQMLIFTEQKISSEMNVEEITDKFKMCVLIQRRLEPLDVQLNYINTFSFNKYDSNFKPFNTTGYLIFYSRTMCDFRSWRKQGSWVVYLQKLGLETEFYMR